MQRPQYVPLAEVARRFNVTTRTVYNWLDRSDIALPVPVKIGNRAYFDSAKLDEWEAKRIASAAEAA